MNTRVPRERLPVWAGILAILAVWFVLVGGRLSEEIQLNHLEGSAMSPALNDGDLVKSALRSSHERDDLVAYSPTKEQLKSAGLDRVSERTALLGRIVGLPDETIEITQASLEIDGVELFSIPQPFRDAGPLVFLPPQRIPKDQYFVLMHGATSKSDSVLSTSNLDSKQLGLISSKQLRRVVDIYSRKRILIDAASEILFGAFILLFIIIFPLYVRTIAVQSLLISFFVFANYAFVGLLVTLLVSAESPSYGYPRLMIAFSSFYQGAMIYVFGNGILSVGAQGIIAVLSAVLLIKSLNTLVGKSFKRSASH